MSGWVTHPVRARAGSAGAGSGSATCRTDSHTHPTTSVMLGWPMTDLALLLCLRLPASSALPCFSLCSSWWSLPRCPTPYEGSSVQHTKCVLSVGFQVWAPSPCVVAVLLQQPPLPLFSSTCPRFYSRSGDGGGWPMGMAANLAPRWL